MPEAFIRVIGLISGQVFLVGLKSGFVSTFVFYILVNQFLSRVKFNYMVGSSGLF